MTHISEVLYCDTLYYSNLDQILLYLWFCASQIYFIMNNQLDAALSGLIYGIIHCEITLHVSGTLCTYHQEYIKLGHLLTDCKPTPHRHMTCTCDFIYSFMYSWWRVQRAPEICRV